MSHITDTVSELQDIVDELENHDCDQSCSHDDPVDTSGIVDDLERLLKQLDKADSFDMVIVSIGDVPLLTVRELRDKLESIKEDLQ
jgi:hypothetical protein